jgi:hypothetical protein
MDQRTFNPKMAPLMDELMPFLKMKEDTLSTTSDFIDKLGHSHFTVDYRLRDFEVQEKMVFEL